MIWELYALAGILGVLVGGMLYSMWVDKNYLSIHVSKVDQECLRQYRKGLGWFGIVYIPNTPKPKAKLKIIKGETNGSKI